MDATVLLGLCLAAGIVLTLMVLIVLWALRMPASDRDEYRPDFRLEYQPSPTPALPPPEVPTPYAVEKRPLPQSDDLDVLLPQRVGPFERQGIRALGDIHRLPIYAEYQAGGAEVFVELGICDDPEQAQEGLMTAKRETDAEFPDEPQRFVCGQDPSFLQARNKLGAFMAWTRGSYYFSAHAKGGEADLDLFMEAFPY